MEAIRSRTSYSPLLVLGHIVNDMFANLLAGLLPVLIIAFGLSYLLAGFVATVYWVTSSVIQPFLGRWFDRTQAVWLLEAGLVVNSICMSLVGISSSYALLLFLVGTAGTGTAAFHPPAFSKVIKSDGTRKGGAVGIFIAGGNVGFFLGPIVAGAVLTAYGLRGTLLLLPIGVIVAAVLLKSRVTGGNPTKHESAAGSNLPVNKSLLVLLAAITAGRSITVQTAETFLPSYFVARGDSLFVATSLASLWLGIGVLGQLGGGFISDRVGRRLVIVTSLLVGAALFLCFVMTSGPMSLAFLILAGAVLYASWSVIVVMSTEAAPRNVGAVSGLMLGFAIGIGGFAALGFGAIADKVGLQAALAGFSGFAFAAGLLALLLPNVRTSSLPHPA